MRRRQDKKLSIRLSDPLRLELEAIARERGEDLSEIVRHALEAVAVKHIRVTGTTALLELVPSTACMMEDANDGNFQA